MKEKTSKEIQSIINSIDKYFKKHKGNVCVVGSFVAFNKENNVIDDRLFLYGEKEVLKEQIYSLAEEIVNCKDEFITI